MSDTAKYDEQYSESGFWGKLQDFAKSAGSDVVKKALILYYAAQSENTPAWAKAAIYGALGYFISPVDAIPDVVPLVGFADDLGVMVAALAAVAMSITDEVKQQAEEKLKAWFG